MDEPTLAQVQRLRVRFGAEGALRYVSHLDVMRVWERVCKRAGLPLSHSQGFSPRPKIALAAPLAVGMTSEAELIDLLLAQYVEPAQARAALEAQAPSGLQILDLTEARLKQASLQSQVRAAQYEIEVEDPRSREEWERAITELLAAETLPREQQRGDKVKHYDLRPLILDLAVAACADGRTTLRMRLRHDERGAGRPEQVALALGAERAPARVHRVRLELLEAATPAGAAAAGAS